MREAFYQLVSMDGHQTDRAPDAEYIALTHTSDSNQFDASRRYSFVLTGWWATNTRRKLNPNEFQGFALADEYAPLVLA